MPTNQARWTPAQRWTLTLAAIAALMITLDALVVSTALNTIRTDLGASLESLEWTVNAYGLTYAVLMMTGSALGDRLGRRRILTAGLAVFTAASAACALAPSVGWLVAARAVQGAGGALIMPVAMALVSAAFEPQQRARAMGIFVALLGVGVVGGPVVGGAVAEALSWQWIFWLNVPIGVVLIPLVTARMAETPRSAARLDIGGVLLATGGAFGVVWALVRGNGAGWGSAEVLATLLGGVALTVAFVRWELRAAAPMLPMRLFGDRTFAVSNAIGFLLFASNFSSVFLVSQFLQAEQGYSPLQAGLRMLPWTATILALAPLAGTRLARIGVRGLVVGGLALQAVGMGAVAVLADAGAPYPAMVVPLMVAGCGISVAMPSSQNAVVGAVPPSAIGQASGTYNTLRQLGGAFGVAVVAAVFSAAGSYATPAHFDDGFVVALAVSAALAVVAAVVGLLLPGRRRQAPPAAAEPSRPLAASARAGQGDDVTATEDFVQQADAYRPELLAHCYRMVGSVHDAEDAVQETYLRAWRSFDRFEGRASLRTWLYRIATNTCLTALERTSRRPLPSSMEPPSGDVSRPLAASRLDVPWLQPLPDALIAPDPAAVVVSRDSVRLAFVAALQHLPPRQRAVLILRDVLAWPAAEVADLLDTTTASVTSALQRARARLAEVMPAEDDTVEPSDAERRALLTRYVTALHDGDVVGLVALLRADASIEMPPIPTWFAGRANVVAFLKSRCLDLPASWRYVPTAANGQLALAAFRRDDEGAYLAHTLHVLTLADGLIARITAFRDPALFALFGLPAEVP